MPVTKWGSLEEMPMTQPVVMPPTLGALLLQSTLDPPLWPFHLRHTLSSLICPSFSEMFPLPTLPGGSEFQVEPWQQRRPHELWCSELLACILSPCLLQLTDQITDSPCSDGMLPEDSKGTQPRLSYSCCFTARRRAFLSSRPGLSFVSQRL